MVRQNLRGVKIGCRSPRHRGQSCTPKHTQTGALEQPYGFTGREHDAESGLVYFRARMFDPQLGQFFSEDTLGFSSGSLNLYSYVANDPINYFDPSGQVRSKNSRGYSMMTADWGLLTEKQMAMTGAAVGAIYAGLVNGPLSSLMESFDQLSLMRSDSGAGATTSTGDGGKQCGPDGPKGPSRWEKIKQAFLKAIEVYATIMSLGDLRQPTPPRVDDIPIQRIEEKLEKMKK